MSIQQSNEKKKPDGKKNHGGNSPTKKTIRAKKDEYCDKLVTLVGTLNAAEENVYGLTTTYEMKKCVFVKTEKNYRITRNLELLTGVELVQASAEISKNVKASITKNDDLVKALKAVCAAAKTAKGKFGELLDAADKLKKCRADSCSTSQLIVLGCKPAGECNEPNEKKQEGENGSNVPKACENACCILDHLVTVPESLSRDIDIINNASAEIMGIQTFTSIKTLEKFQADFEANAKAFDEWVVARMGEGKTAVDAAQKELVDATKLLTTATYSLYNARTAVEAVDTTKDYLCCHKCKCLDDDDECGCNDLDNDNDRLKACKCEICDICEEVTHVYCDCGKTGEEKCAD